MKETITWFGRMLEVGVPGEESTGTSHLVRLSITRIPRLEDEPYEEDEDFMLGVLRNFDGRFMAEVIIGCDTLVKSSPRKKVQTAVNEVQRMLLSHLGIPRAALAEKGRKRAR